MTEETKAYELNLERALQAPVRRVWEALTREGELARWYGPSDDFRVEVLEWDCRVGGGYRVAMHAPDGNTHTCFGVFQEIAAPRRLAYTWSWESQPPMDTLVVFELVEDGSATRLRFSHTGFPAGEVRDRHEEGWTGSLERLGRLVFLRRRAPAGWRRAPRRASRGRSVVGSRREPAGRRVRRGQRDR
jgi:uncharacterized protein YndB with AHSA1/START domain